MKMKEEKYTGTGRRKTSVARVMIKPGNGEIKVNSKQAIDYFKTETYMRIVKRPLDLTATTNKYNISISVKGGGLIGQAGAISLGIARALSSINKDLKVLLAKESLLTRDSRMVERKKYGQSGARRRFQFSKR